MSASDVKAEAVIELETSSLETASKKVEKQFKKIGDSATKSGQKADKAMGKTGTSATKAATKIKDVGTAGTTAGDKVTQGANKGATALDKMGTSADGAANGMETLSTSMIGIAQGATGISDAIFGLSASFVGLEKTGFGIKGMQVAVRRMEEDLVVAFKAGTATVRELERSVEDLELAYEGLALEEKQVDADTLALNGQIVTLTINIAATVVQTVIAISVLKTMRLVTANNAIATAGDSAAKVVNTGVTATMTGAIVASAVAVKAFTIAMLTSPLAPYAIAAIGAGTAFIALNDNIGGVRDSIEDLTGQDRGSFPTLGFSITQMGVDMKTAEESLLAYGDEAGEFTEKIGSTTDSINSFIEALNPGSTTALDTFGTSLGGVTKKLIPFANGIFDASGNLVNLKDRASNMNPVMDAWTRKILQTTTAITNQNKALVENAKNLDIIKKKQQTSNNGFGSDSDISTRRPRQDNGSIDLATHRNLPPELQGFFSIARKPGISQSTRIEIAAKDGFANSARAKIQQILGIGTTGGNRSNGRDFKRNNRDGRLLANLQIINKARRKGIISLQIVRNNFPGFESGLSTKDFVRRASGFANQLKPIITQFDIDLTASQLAVRRDNFSPLANILNISSTDFRASEFVGGVASELNISQGNALSRLQQGDNGADLANQIRFARRTIKELEASSTV